MSKSGDRTKGDRAKTGERTKAGDERDAALAQLEKALNEALARSEAAETMLEDQRQRIKALGVGREETMRTLAETREELRRVSEERDELRDMLARVDGVQTATIALPDNDFEPTPETVNVPSLEDLMGALDNTEAPASEPIAGHLHQRVTHAHDPSGEMISPELVFPEKFAKTAKAGEHGDVGPDVSRVLVLLDPEKPISYPLFKPTMTIGRADIADIQINNGFLSRLHAQLISTPAGVTIEDVESKNGIRVNSKKTPRQLLKHGDVVDLGRLRFRYLDTASGDPE
jgi:hypothetical protein